MTAPSPTLRFAPVDSMAMLPGEHALERQELERVLVSGVFDRAPSLAQVLIYVCLKHFEGTSHELKEYNIAVDALGRSVDFDQKKDSIVRVQMHRLRERLAEYYLQAGAQNALAIEIPQGQYAPRFIQREPLAPSEVPRKIAPVGEPAAISIPAPGAIPPSVAPGMAPRLTAWTLAAGTLVLLTVVLSVRAVSDPIDRKLVTPIVTAAPGDSVRILVGLNEGTFTDGFGKSWDADRDFDGGTVIRIPERPVRGTREPKLYQNRRQGVFAYHIPLKPGVYELRLHFAELHFGEDNLAGFGGEGSRAFGIDINGKTVLQRMDVIGEAGAGTAHVRVFKGISPAEDGKVHIKFNPLVSVPFVNGIEITPGTSGKLQPIRIVMQERAYTDPQGRSWLPDRYAIGGQMAKRPPLEGAPDPALFAGERFGNLAYAIPLPPGRYTVNLYMAERWIGPGMPGGGRGGVGTRVFDILANGILLAHNFDVFKRAGGPDRPLVQTFRGLEPNHQGYISLTFVPYLNFPMVSAIEVLDDAR